MITIKNLRYEKPKNPWDKKVCRGASPLGNPFHLNDTNNDEKREMVCERYEGWFYEELFDSVIQAELYLLMGTYKKYGKLNLFCWCAPKRCHAETIKTYLEKRLSDESYTSE